METSGHLCQLANSGQRQRKVAVNLLSTGLFVTCTGEAIFRRSCVSLSQKDSQHLDLCKKSVAFNLLASLTA